MTGAHLTKNEALADWNTRAAPPIGQCKDCMFAYNWKNGEASCVINNNVIIDESSFCESFTKKEG